MKPQAIKDLVNEGVQISKRLDEIKATLIEESNGAKTSFDGDDGNRVDVSFTAPSIGRLEEEADIEKARKTCGKHFDALFRGIYAPVKAFRDLVPAILKPDAVEKLMAQVIKGKGSARVSFKSAS